MRTYGWRSWGEAIGEALIGVASGIVLSFVESGGTKQMPDGETLARNALILAMVILASRGLETALSWAIEQSNVPTLFRTIIYAAGGWIGYIVGVVIASGLAPEADDFGEGGYHLMYSLLGTGIAAITTGLVLHHNRKRNDRLRASIERLKEHEFAEKELEIARSMQQRLLPPPVIERDGFRVTAHMHAAHLVGGDFYDVLRLGNEGETAILAADVAGKGIAASLIMATCKAMVPFLASSGDAASVMTALNARLCEGLQRREFVAMVFVRLDPARGVAEIVNAGMPDPLLVGADRSVREVAFTGDRLPLGAMRASRYEATRITLARGERLLLFSDGLPEATTGEGTVLGYERVRELAARAASVDALVSEVRAVATVGDDLTVVAVELL
jgi:Stage II sporulation protein E (SpoIIE)